MLPGRVMRWWWLRGLPIGVRALRAGTYDAAQSRLRKACRDVGAGGCAAWWPAPAHDRLTDAADRASLDSGLD
jgi:hypothetical protein